MLIIPTFSVHVNRLPFFEESVFIPWRHVVYEIPKLRLCLVMTEKVALQRDVYLCEILLVAY